MVRFHSIAFLLVLPVAWLAISWQIFRLRTGVKVQGSTLYTHKI